MKNLRILGVAATFAAASVVCFAQPPATGPVDVKLSSIQQNIDDQPTYTTNKTSTSTNFTDTQLYTTATTNLNNTQLLTMLANSYNMTWPAGSMLKLGNGGDFVIANGTTIVQDVSSVFYLSNMNNGVYSGSEVVKETLSKNGESESESAKYIETVSAVLVYDDSTFSPANGSITQIQVNGMETVHGVLSSVSETSTQAISFIGTGTGTNFNSGLQTSTYIVGGTVNGTSLNDGP